MSARPFLQVALISLAAAITLAIFAQLTTGSTTVIQDLPQVHLILGIFGALIPGITGLHLHGLAALHERPAPLAKAKLAATTWLVGALVLALAAGLTSGRIRLPALALGGLALTAAAVLTMLLLIKLLPRRGQSVVDVAKDPLTKGDDASLKQAKFAHFFLVPAVAATTLAGPWMEWTTAWAPRTWLAGLHLLLAGYALVSTYSITHLWIPRLANVPAIAAGAIKGELHSSLLGLLLLVAGFLFDVRGLTIAGGAFLFFGCFTWMGVLGANIMRNKSKTQRVTPEFTYIPWVFTGVFWLVCGVLLGEFLNAVPATFADRFGALRFTHAHAILLGGYVQIAIGLAMRLVPMARGTQAIPFHEGKWGFYLLNLGLAGLIIGAFGTGLGGRTALWGGGLALLGVAVAFMSLVRNPKRLRN